MENKVYGYARVSSKEQNLDRQIIALKEYGVEEKNIKYDKQSGKDFNRESYQLLKNELLRENDTLVIKELDRLGRNKDMIKEEWNELINRGINIEVIDMPVINTSGKSDLEKSLIVNIVFELLTYMAEKERLKIRKRQREGIDALKERNGGKGIGRPAIEYPSNWKEVYDKLKEKEINVKEAMGLLNMKRTSFYKLMKKYEK
ncbi:recombinase family protein [Clostridium butyricum]|uniref:recombinase family protein n=1 Tax=Clostridium butyricum TaxID=1492 RepID=UPI002AB1BA22|nr:recombinase family protein [Clostridium butyricum]